MGNERSRKLETPVQGVSHVVLTILNADGTPTAVDGKSLPALPFGEELMIEDISLPGGSDQLSTFYLTDSSGNILYATPLEGSEFGDYLAEPLPISFEIATNGTESLGLEIISTAAQNPESFGFETGMAGFRETFYFFISVIREKVDEFMEFIPAELTVRQGYQIVTQELSGKLNKIVLPKNSEQYDFLISYGPFQPVSKKISYDSLLLFHDRPLVIEMSKKRDDEFYVGGVFDGHARLYTQSQVDSFGQKAYEMIKCDLSLGYTALDSNDPITDLSFLATIETITGNLNIEGNPILKSLDGLQYVSTVSGGLVIRDNPFFESYRQMMSLENLGGLFLINNPSMQDFGGLEDALPTVSLLQIEQMDHFLNFEDFENALNLTLVTIRSNPNVTHLIFPPLTKRINLQIVGNPSLISFGEGEGIIGRVRNLVLSDNKNLENLAGLISPKGSGIQGLNINKMPKITSLTPLVFNELINRDIWIADNESLKEISAFSSAKTIETLITILNNPSLDDFCGLKGVFIDLPSGDDYANRISGNAYNPTYREIQTGKCKP